MSIELKPSRSGDASYQIVSAGFDNRKGGYVGIFQTDTGSCDVAVNVHCVKFNTDEQAQTFAAAIAPRLDEFIATFHNIANEVRNA